MEKEDLEKIIENYSWIKVKKYNEVSTWSYDWDEEAGVEHYKELLNHHKTETEFLINKCRELATELLKYKK